MIEETAAPILEDNGSLVGCVLVLRDVSDSYHAVEEQRRLAAIVESSEDAIVSEGLDGTILSWNRGAQRLYGYTPEEIVGRPVSVLYPPTIPTEEGPNLLNRLRRGERIDQLETTRLRKDGSIVAV